MASGFSGSCGLAALRDSRAGPCSRPDFAQCSTSMSLAGSFLPVGRSARGAEDGGGTSSMASRPPGGLQAVGAGTGTRWFRKAQRPRNRRLRRRHQWPLQIDRRRRPLNLSSARRCGACGTCTGIGVSEVTATQCCRRLPRRQRTLLPRDCHRDPVRLCSRMALETAALAPGPGPSRTCSWTSQLRSRRSGTASRAWDSASVPPWTSARMKGRATEGRQR
mmetsp:Transcript_115827/g.258907  ORF Transcript_115827/g.258907 Transcript_115827/m.258907 type:complete len:220 (-) Transcript_115827:121-780(-)